MQIHGLSGARSINYVGGRKVGGRGLGGLICWGLSLSSFGFKGRLGSSPSDSAAAFHPPLRPVNRSCTYFIQGMKVSFKISRNHPYSNICLSKRSYSGCVKYSPLQGPWRTSLGYSCESWNVFALSLSNVFSLFPSDISLQSKISEAESCFVLACHAGYFGLDFVSCGAWLCVHPRNLLCNSLQ